MPNIHVSRAPSGCGSRTRAVASRPTAATVASTAPSGTSHAVRVDRYSERPAREHQEPEEAGPRAERESGCHPGRAAGDVVRLVRRAPVIRQITWIHRVATSVVAPTAITTVRRNPRR